MDSVSCFKRRVRCVAVSTLWMLSFCELGPGMRNVRSGLAAIILDDNDEDDLKNDDVCCTNIYIPCTKHVQIPQSSAEAFLF